MTCEEFEERLAAEFDPGSGGDADRSAAHRAESADHVQSCAKCRDFAVAAKRLRRDLELEREVGAAASLASARARPELTRIAQLSRLARVAAAAALLLVGVALGGLLTWRFVPGRATANPAAIPPAHPTEDDGPRFLLALYERGPVDAPPPPAEVGRKIVGDYVAWAHSLADGHHLDTADRLRGDACARLQMRSGRVVVDEELPGPGELRLGGFFLIKASSMDEAILLARASPHLRYGGEIEIREVDRSR